MEQSKLERVKCRPLLSLPTVPEEEEKEEDEVKVREVREEAESDISEDEALPMELNVHGLKAKVYLNCADVDVIPARYLEKAERSPMLKRTPWIFRAARDGRDVNLSKWSRVDIRFRGVFKTLKKVPPFTRGLFESDSGRMASSASSKLDFEEAVKAQGQVVYALMDEILNMLRIRRETESHREYFYLRPRLICCQPEYWTGYRVKHWDTPVTAGSISLDYSPAQGASRAVMPVLTTAERRQNLKSALEGEFKLLLAQLLVNVHRLAPPGDKLPDQEAFLIVLHGSKLHILRGIFPGQKTSKLWCGRHKPADPDSESTHNLVAKMSDRFYSKMNLERFMEQVEWNQLSNPENESCPRVFQIFGSREYDLWMEWEFAAALKMLSGLIMYLMSGQARCGILQHVFERYPYDEGIESESDDGKEAEKVAKEQKLVQEKEKKFREKEEKKREEYQARVSEREAMRSSAKDRIGGLTEGFRQPWWDWVWEDKHTDGCAKDDADIILHGP
ncbi:hypothetical protein BDW59DRAFT_157270 [Aspergillus cavernicola]|uniref:Aminoglycoside phosphotransferase domain-containing protein n=1 Tax=Aspergillus cavernicola TaxID=176166 RepID=A0ABR4IXE0_9EURO